MLIGIGGEIDSGKSTAAKIIIKEFGYTEKSFAKNLKEMSKNVFRLTEEQVNTQEGKATPFYYPFEFTEEHVRHLLLWIQNVNHIAVTDAHRMKAHQIQQAAPLFTTPRQILQFIGTEFCRGIFGDDFHVHIVFEEIARECLDRNKVVISDARFANERAAIKGWGGMTLLVEDVNAPKKTAGAKHASETSLGSHSEYDCVYFNDKKLGLGEMEKRLVGLLRLQAGNLKLDF